MDKTEYNTNTEQTDNLNMNMLGDILDLINQQTATVEPETNPIDNVAFFINKFLNLPDTQSLEDRSIYINPDLTDFDREYLSVFTTQLGYYLSRNLGIDFADGDIYLYYAVYKIFVTRFIDYFVYYLNGLQQLDYEFVDDIPNYQELHFETFRKKNNGLALHQSVSEYIDFILEYGLCFGNWFEIILLESNGNVEASALYTEQVNYRLVLDDKFLEIKLNKIVSSLNIKNVIISRFIEVNGFLSGTEVLDN